MDGEAILNSVVKELNNRGIYSRVSGPSVSGMSYKIKVDDNLFRLKTASTIVNELLQDDTLYVETILLCSYKEGYVYFSPM